MPSDSNFTRLLREKFGDDSSITLEQHQEYFMGGLPYDESLTSIALKLST